jgi:hypothetical protein
MRKPRVIAALVLSLCCGSSAAACTQSTETSPETPQTTAAEDTATGAIDDGDVDQAKNALGEFGAGTIGGSDFGHLDLGGPKTGGPLNPTGQCEDACYAVYVAQSVICSRLPRPRRRACWERAAEDLALCIRDCSRNP